jgi:hypothetical protein
LGRCGIEVSEIGFGCWAIGGPFSMDGRPDGWGEVDDGESVAAVRLNLLTEHDARGQERITLPRAQHEHLLAKIDWYRSQLSAAHT